MISAARLVNVRSRILPGSAPELMRCATRWARVLVLPVPAPAMMSKGEEWFVAAASWAGLRTWDTYRIYTESSAPSGGQQLMTAEATTRGLETEDHAVQRELAAAQDGEGERDDQQHEFEFPAGRVLAGEVAVDFGDEELERAEHRDHESERGELGQKAEQHAQAAGGLGDREDAKVAQHAGGQLRGGVHAPHFSLAEPVGEEDGAKGDAKGEQGKVAESVQLSEQYHDASRSRPLGQRRQPDVRFCHSPCEVHRPPVRRQLRRANHIRRLATTRPAPMR